MEKEIKKWLAIISIMIVIWVILLLLVFGFELSGFEIHRGIKIN